MDIDNFRDFNNTYGHHVGDSLLQAISSSLKENLRGTDLIDRWGGEEFPGIFAIDEAGEACEVAEKVLMLAANSEIMHEGQRISVTCSVGVAIVREDDMLHSIVERSDAYMYRSKKCGKTVQAWKGIMKITMRTESDLFAATRIRTVHLTSP